MRARPERTAKPITGSSSILIVSNRQENQKKSRKKTSIVKSIIKQVKKRRDQANCIKFNWQNQHNNSISSNINFDPGFSEIKKRINVPNLLNPLIKIFAEKLIKLHQI